MDFIRQSNDTILLTEKYDKWNEKSDYKDIYGY